MNILKERYPLQITLDAAEGAAGEAGALTLRPMTPADDAAILAFAKALPAHDLLYVRRDITNAKVVKAWGDAIDEGSIKTVLATDDSGAIVGCVALIRDPLSWSPHVGEVRVLVSETMRGKGLGRVLIQECFRIAIADSIKKLIAQMTVDQKGAVSIFEELGFRGEALLKDHVMDRHGETHDIVVLSCDMERISAQHSLYGMNEAV